MESTTRQQPKNRPKRSLGQNFLIDQTVAQRVVDALDLTPTDVVVEIGPGRGALTTLLAERAGHVTAVEMDDALAPELAHRYSSDDSVTIVHGDALEVDLADLVQPSTAYKIVGNLPYNVASPIIRRFLTAEHRPQLMVVMLQLEVAEALASAPGSITYMSVEVQLWASVEVLFSVPSESFRPRPRVTSAIVALVPHLEPVLDLESEQHFLEVVRAGFSARRKQLHNSLGRGLDLGAADVRAMLETAGIDGTRRAQTLALPEWGAVYGAFQKLGRGA
jgi:16S rRNA (adenine1518-N6/adenine1519-N6)-dimethyltransferase